MIGAHLEGLRPTEALFVELPGGLGGELVRIGRESAPVGYFEFGRAYARWSLETEEPCSEQPPGAEEAGSLRKSTYYATADKLSPAQAKIWAAGIIRSQRSSDVKVAWRIKGRPRVATHGLKGILPLKWERSFTCKIPGGPSCVLKPASGYPTWIGEKLEGRVDDAHWWLRVNGWPVHRRPTTEPGMPTEAIRKYGTTEDLSASEAEGWARRVAAADRPLTRAGP